MTDDDKKLPIDGGTLQDAVVEAKFYNQKLVEGFALTLAKTFDLKTTLNYDELNLLENVIVPFDPTEEEALEEWDSLEEANQEWKDTLERAIPYVRRILDENKSTERWERKLRDFDINSDYFAIGLFRSLVDY